MKVQCSNRERNRPEVRHHPCSLLADLCEAVTFNPGEEQRYSNSGYTLLSEIVAKVSGQSFAQFTRNEIFNRIGMTNTHFHSDYQSVEKNMAYSYYSDGHGAYKKSILNFGTVGATGLHSTANDLAKWISNFQRTNVGGPTLLAQMQAEGTLNNGNSIAYGFGLAIERFRNARMIQHGGGDASYRSFILWFPDLGLGVAVLSNLGSINTREIALLAAETYLADRLPPIRNRDQINRVPASDPTERSLEIYSGLYDVSWGDTVQISRVREHLEVRFENQPWVPLVSMGEHRFLAGIESFAFEPPHGGLAASFTNQLDQIYRRVDQPVEALPDLTEYVGKYWSQELEAPLTVRLHEKKLVIELLRHGQFTLRYLVRNNFGSEGGWWLRVKFQRNAEDEILGVRVNGLLFTKRESL